MNVSGKKPWAALVPGAILVLALCLRLYALGRESIWFDEAASIEQSSFPPLRLVTDFYLPPLYFLLLKLWFKAFGLTVYAGRLFSVLLGVLAVLMVYKAGKKLPGGRAAALFGAFVAAVAPFQLFYSREIRHYALFLCLSMVSLYSFLLYLRKEGRGKGVTALFCLSTAALPVAHLWGVFILAIENIYYFAFYRRQGVGRWLCLQALILVPYALWMIPFAAFMRAHGGYAATTINWIRPPDARAVLDTFVDFAECGFYSDGGKNPAFFSGVRMLPAFFLLALLSCAGLVSLWLKRAREAFLFALWLGLPVAVLFVFSRAVFPVYSSRYLIFISPAFYLLAGAGFALLKGRALRTAAVCCAAACFVPSLHFFFSHRLNPEWERAVGYMEKTAAADVCVLSLPPENYRVFQSIALRRGQPFSHWPVELGGTLYSGGVELSCAGMPVFGISDPAQLARALAGREWKGFWVISNRWASPETLRTVRGRLAAEYAETACAGFDGIELYYFAKR